MARKQAPQGKQAPMTSNGKSANDANRLGNKDTTQLNQGQRTPDSWHDRQAHVGGGNQSQSRRGPVDSPKR